MKKGELSMSLMNDFQIGIFIFFSIVTIAFSIFIVKSKNVFYSAISLAFLGISIAILIADISPVAYSLYSAFHLLLYVGATVVFMSISLVMFRGIRVKEINISWAPIIAILTSVVIFSVVLISISSLPSRSPSPISLEQLGLDILQKYWFPAVILIIGLLTTMIEAISLARRD